MSDTRQATASAERAVQQGKQWAELRTAGQWMGWLELDPALAKNRICLAAVNSDGTQTYQYPLPDISARSRVHEYGGGSWCLWADGLAYVNEADQGIYWLALNIAEALPQKIWQVQDCRYGDLVFDDIGQRLLAVEEDHSEQALNSNPSGVREPINRLVAIALSGDSAAQRVVMAEGADFYSSPAIGPVINGQQQVSWLSWNHPWQPWLSTTVSLADVLPDGGVNLVWQFNADGQAISCVQPGFDSDGNLVFVADGGGYWNLYRYLFDGASKAPQCLYPVNKEFGSAQWQLGSRQWASVKSGLAGCCVDPQTGLAEIGKISSNQSEVSDYYRFDAFDRSKYQAARYHGLAYNDRKNCVYAIEERQDRGPAILQWSLDEQSSTAAVLYELDADSKTASTVVKPVSVHIPLPASEGASKPEPSSIQGWWYAPVLEAGQQQQGTIIQLHGGPTSYADSSFDALKQFWCEQGFGLLMLNYRGSSCLGKKYRSALKEQWGITDVEDVFAACDWLQQQNMAQAGRIFVRGGSAGGYTVLQVLSHPQAATHGIAAGASHYGISDLLLLNQFTHKFESRYLDWLIGDETLHRQRYIERSAINNLDSFNLPVIFFQGANDKVVPPEQSRAIYDALQQRQIRSEFVLFEGEGHGFRKAENRQQVLLQELAFYLSL